MEIINIVTLSLTGLLLTYVGTSRLINPIKTYSKSSGIELSSDVNLLNELRGLSVVMLIGGILAFLSILLSELITSAFIVGALIFLGFAFGRLISAAVDGKPNKKIIQGIWFELVLGTANVIGLVYALG